jgi:hypothetical protein
MKEQDFLQTAPKNPKSYTNSAMATVDESVGEGQNDMVSTKKEEEFAKKVEEMRQILAPLIEQADSDLKNNNTDFDN